MPIQLNNRIFRKSAVVLFGYLLYSLGSLSGFGTGEIVERGPMGKVQSNGSSGAFVKILQVHQGRVAVNMDMTNNTEPASLST